MRSKKPHKDIIERNLLIIELATKTGLRRAELEKIIVADINLEKQK